MNEHERAFIASAADEMFAIWQRMAGLRVEGWSFDDVKRCARVLDELRLADRRARQLAGLPPRVYPGEEDTDGNQQATQASDHSGI